MDGATEADRVSSADLNGALIQVGKFLAAHDVRDEDENDFVFLVLDVSGGEQVLEQRNLREARQSAEGLDVLVLEDAAEKIDFAFLQANFVLDFALTDDGLRDAANIAVSGYGGNVHHHLERDFATGVDVRRDIDVDADIEVLELGVDERVDADAADTGLERTSGHGHPVADFE